MTEVFVLQFFILYTLYNIYLNSNMFYVMFYTLLQIVLFGIFLSFYQMELFSAFLWLSESVVIFVSLLLVFYLNVYGTSNKINLKFNSFKFYGLFFFLILSIWFLMFPVNFEYLNFNSYFDNLNDDWYEAVYNSIITDLFGLFMSYYFMNSLEFLMMGLFLLMGSLICVNMNKVSRLNKTLNYQDMFTVFDFFKDFVKFIFMSKQNLVDQEIHVPSSSIFKKKVIIIDTKSEFSYTSW